MDAEVCSAWKVRCAMKLLIGYDGSTCSNAALDDLRRAGIPADVEARVLSVGEFWLPPPASYGLIDMDFKHGADGRIREATDLAAAGRDRLLTTFPGWNVVAEARGGSPARHLLEIADEWKPDLVVVGSHGRRGLAKLFLGSVSQKVASEASCSVRIARERVAEPGAPVRIMIGVDGSPGSNAAVRAAARRAWPKGSQARLVTAFGPVAIDGHETPGELEHVYALHAPVFDQLWSAGLETTSAIDEADPREFLLREAEQWGADCIFLGATGLLLLDRFLFGTVVAAITARAHCSVEVVRERL
jgi:nucleotide-binding universal stress UspA family protein